MATNRSDTSVRFIGKDEAMMDPVVRNRGNTLATGHGVGVKAMPPSTWTCNRLAIHD